MVTGKKTPCSIRSRGNAIDEPLVDAEAWERRKFGVPVPNALVAGGDILVRTDENGLFELTGVPTGQTEVSAGVVYLYTVPADQ